MKRPIQSSEIFNFSSGVTIEFIKDKIIASATNYSNTINFKNLDNFRYNDYQENRITTVGLLSRALAISFFLMIFNKVLSFQNPNTSDILFYSGLLLFVLTFISFFIFMLDVFLEFRFFDSIILKFFSNKGYLVIIGNNSGNNIEFYATLDDLKLINELESKVFEIKKNSEDGLNSADKIVSINKENYLLELEKLNELLQSGIINQEDFDLKKKQILGI